MARHFFVFQSKLNESLITLKFVTENNSNNDTPSVISCLFVFFLSFFLSFQTGKFRRERC